MNGKQAGDPAKLARALVQLADSDEPPLRWVAGADAVEGVEQKARILLAQVDAHPSAVDQPRPRRRLTEPDRDAEETVMRGAVMHGPGDVRVEEREEPRIVEPTDAIIRLSATCVCGSDLWPYRGIGIEEAESARADGPRVRRHRRGGRQRRSATIRPGQFVVGSFFASDNTCEICRAGYQSSCVHRERIGAGAPGRVRCASRSPTAPSSPPRTSRPTT